MSETGFSAGADVLTRRAGLRLDPALRGRVERCLIDAAHDAGLTMDEYVVRLEEDFELLQDLLNRVTVQETHFFRDDAQYRALRDRILPGLPQGTTIWSAGCANGQEAYSLAMLLIEAGRRDVHVLASDISTHALARARRAWYKASEVRSLEPLRRDRFMVGKDDGFELVPEVREMVSLQRLNLTSDRFPILPGGCHVVFCRNVLIYFTRDEVHSFLDRLAAWMPVDGHLFLGYSESLWQVTSRFTLTRLGDTFVYTLGTGAAKTGSERRPPAKTVDTPPPRKAKVPDLPKPEELLAAGEASMGAGDVRGAIDAFRRAVYLDPDHPIAHFQLGVALESAGQLGPARRAYSAARGAVARGDTARLLLALEGYSADSLVAILDAKLEALA